MAARPLVLPEPFDGEANWEQWDYHFQNVVSVNEWDDGQKLKWLKVRLTGRAQIAFQRLPETTRNDYDAATKALKDRFEPASRKPRYQAELQTHRKKKRESWADFAEDLRLLADKAFPEFQDGARERLALNAYVAQLDHPQVGFGVKQRSPETLDAAVTVMLELEACLTPRATVSWVELELEATPTKETSTVAAVSSTDKLASLVEKLVDRVERLKQVQTRGNMPGPRGWRSGRSDRRQPMQRPPRTNGLDFARRYRDTACWSCGEMGHLASQCQESPRQQGN